MNKPGFRNCTKGSKGHIVKITPCRCLTKTELSEHLEKVLIRTFKRDLMRIKTFKNIVCSNGNALTLQKAADDMLENFVTDYKHHISFKQNHKKTQLGHVYLSSEVALKPVLTGSGNEEPLGLYLSHVFGFDKIHVIEFGQYR